ncbi:Glycerophosphoryl diester phosphodiesterase [Hartmannibacter diazotrophicus]|uniref:Glycerophosphoryl diester phosphodiesterase n=1 Tax=Hartmannibacter diazotrophicus TaxID=1482074 RepID=A0A2C9D6V2_9HYPH|nr:glycerophosphodiester phosphodiesterase family protein [Hartmannibacter diazotrophicus]SON56016.1 Glycerophosphoryl diester phosphodiesterase [Hartmannibacter diazotrophicus]
MGHADWLIARPVAHRGLHDIKAGRVENTPSAVEAAIARNFAIEIDIHLSADGEAFVFHDSTLDRLTEGTGPVAAMTIADLKRVPFTATSDRIPTLDEVLEIVGGKVPIVIEVKSFAGHETTALVARSVEIVRAYKGPAALMSFDPGAVLAMRQLAPDIPRGIVADDCSDEDDWGGFSRWQRFYLRNLLHAPKTRPHFVNYWVKALPTPAPALLRRLGVPILTWTIRTAEDVARASRHADQIVFEGFDPDLGNAPPASP